MYIKLVSDYSQASGIERDGANQLAAALGGATSVTSPFVTAFSALNQGTNFTTGMYNFQLTENTTSSSQLTITKYHYAKNGSYTPSCKILIWHHVSGFYINTTTSNGTNWLPIVSNYQWTVSGSPGFANGQHYNNIESIHVIINDTTFAMQVQTSGTDVTRDHGTFILNDLEYVPEIDDAAYAANSQYFPFVGYWHFLGNNTRVNSVPGGGASDNNVVIGRSQYLDQFNTFRNTSIASAATQYFHHGAQGATAATYATIEPRPRNRIYPIPSNTTGETINQLVPIHYMGHFDDLNGQGDPRRGRLINWYRTTDELGPTGSVLLDNGIRYRLLGDVGKGGTGVETSSSYNICYAFPEDNIPFGG